MAGFDDIKGVNSLLGDRGEDLLKRRSERIAQKSKKELQNVQKMAQNLKEIDDVTNRLEMDFEARINRLTQLNTSIEEIKRQQQQSLQNRTQVANNQFQNQLNQMTGIQSQRGDISQLSQSSSLYGQSYGLANKYGTPELEQAMMHSQRQLQNQNARALSAAENIDDPNSQEAFRRAMASRDRSIRDIARARQAIDIQRQQGMDIRSQHQRGMGIVSGIQSHAQQMQLREDVAAGRVKRSDVEEKLGRVTEQLIKSFNDLDKAVTSNANNAGKLAIEFSEVASQYDRHSETLKEIDRQGGGGGGNAGSMRQMLGGFGNMMAGGAQVTSAIAQYQQFANVNAPLMDIQNRTMMGNITNQRFQDAYGATQGDVRSLRRVLSDSFADAVRESTRIGQSQRGVLETQRLSAGMDTAGGAVMGALSFTPAGRVAGAAKGLSRAGQIAQGVGQGAQAVGGVSGSASEFMRLGVDLDRQISQSQVFGQGFNAMRAMQDAMSHIDDFAGQKGLDRFTTLGRATRGLGTGVATADMFDTSVMTGSGALTGRATGIRDGKVLTAVDEIREQTVGSERARETLKKMGINPDDPAQRQKINQNVRRVYADRIAKPQLAEDQEEAASMGISLDKYQRYKAGMEADSERGFWTKAKEFFVGPSDENIQRRLQIGAELDVAGKIKRPQDAIRAAELGPQVDEADKFNISRIAGQKYFHPTGGVGRVTSRFGPRAAPTAGASTDHKGTDIGAPLGAPIYSMTDAVVKRMGYQEGGAGHYVVLGNDQEEFTYMHQLNQSKLKVGQKITAGQQIGQVGSSGVSTGAHLDVRGRDLRTGQFFDLEQRMDLGGGAGVAGVSPLNQTGAGISTVVGQGGGRRESAFRRLMDPALMRELAQRGLGREQDLARVVGTGVAGLGVEMERDLEGTLRGAGAFSQAGYFQSPEQYVQARSMLSGVGGTGDDLEEIMKTAVAAGMDSSKNIMEMVAATQNLAQRSALQGTMAAQGAAGSLGAALAAADYLPENMRTAAALQSANVAQSLTKSKELTLGNIVEAAGIRSAIGQEGLDATNLTDLENLMTMSNDEYRQMVNEYQKNDKAGQKYMEEQFGIRNIEKVIPNLQVARGIAASGMQGGVLNTGAPFGDQAGNRLYQRYIQSVRSGTDPGFSEDEQRQLRLFERATSRSVGTSSAVAAMDFTRGGPSSAQADATIDSMRATGNLYGMAGSAERTDAAKGIADTNLSIEGMNQFKQAFGGLEAIGTNLQGIADQLKASDFAEQTKQAMDNLQAPIGTFSETMRGLNSDMETFSNQMGEIIRKMEQGAGSGGGSDLSEKLDRLIDKLDRQQNNPMGGNGAGGNSKFGGY